MLWLLNSAVVAAAGLYRYDLLTEEQARAWLVGHIREAESRIGYPATADHIASLCGMRPAVSRDASQMAAGDEALVVRLPYRVPDPSQKGAHAPQAWEYGLLRREA